MGLWPSKSFQEQFEANVGREGVNKCGPADRGASYSGSSYVDRLFLSHNRPCFSISSPLSLFLTCSVCQALPFLIFLCGGRGLQIIHQAPKSHDAAVLEHSHLTTFNLFYKLKYSQHGLDIIWLIDK